MNRPSDSGETLPKEQAVSNISSALRFRELAQENNKLFRESIPLIASENLMSPLAMEMLLSDFGFRYAEGLPGHRYYQGNQIVDQMEEFVVELGKKLFNARQIDPRPISGTVANMGTIYGLTSPGDTITTPALAGGGHISAAEFGAVGFRGLRRVELPFDPETMSVKPSEAASVIRKERPKVVLVGQSVFLFPAPLNEISEAAREVGAPVWYDGAHVLGLIAGRQFQDPLREGADLITGSTHKTFPGPQHGIAVGNAPEDTWKKIQRGMFPGVLSNHHLNTMAALGVTLAEELEFGERYARDIIRNSRALGEELHNLGFRVLGEKLGFTRSHTLALDVRPQGGGKLVAETLERCGIILNKNMLPDDDSRKSQNPSGIRIGSQEVTRLGMGPSEMKEIASLINRAVAKHESPEEIKNEVFELKKRFREVKYCFGRLEAYRYFRIMEE